MLFLVPPSHMRQIEILEGNAIKTQRNGKLALIPSFEEACGLWNQKVTWLWVQALGFSNCVLLVTILTSCGFSFTSLKCGQFLHLTVAVKLEWDNVYTAINSMAESQTHDQNHPLQQMFFLQGEVTAVDCQKLIPTRQRQSTNLGGPYNQHPFFSEWKRGWVSWSETNSSADRLSLSSVALLPILLIFYNTHHFDYEKKKSLTCLPVSPPWEHVFHLVQGLCLYYTVLDPQRWAQWMQWRVMLPIFMEWMNEWVDRLLRETHIYTRTPVTRSNSAIYLSIIILSIQDIWNPALLFRLFTGRSNTHH